MRGGDARRMTLLSLLIVTPLGFWLKFYDGPGQEWVNNYAVGALYEVFWCLFVFLLWPRLEQDLRNGRIGDEARIALGVFVATSLLEVLQLWHPWALEQARATFLGRALLGTTFAWWDFPHYALGCALGWVWMKKLGEPASEDAYSSKQNDR